MAGNYIARLLTSERIREAFPMIAVQDPQISIRQWVEYAARLVDGANGEKDRGILTVQDVQDRILGLSVFHIRPDLRRGRILDVENFAVANLVAARHIAGALLDALETLARERGCGCVSLSLLDPATRRWLKASDTRRSDLFKAAGFQVDAARLRKCRSEQHEESREPGAAPLEAATRPAQGHRPGGFGDTP